jgi:glycosyltransferase involved in cell wall biosynthesis
MIKVFLICSGLGHVKRGFESFTQECFEVLSKEPFLDITLFKGGGEFREKEIVLGNLSRNSWIATQLGRVISRDSYFIEQVSFFLNLLPYIYRHRPDVIYFSDGNLGNLLWHWRRIFQQSYKLLFSNGAPFPPPFPRWDHVQQVAPVHLQQALDAGVPVQKQSLIPYGIHITPQLPTLPLPKREALRCRLGLPEKQLLLLSVGAINQSHKRMDYVIREVASLPEPRFYLLLLGQQDSESPQILQMGNQYLGVNQFQIRTVAQSEMADYYRIADAVVLASLCEGLPRAVLEAMSYGLPCMVHDYEISQYILGKDGYLANFELTGSLAGLMRQVLAEGDDESKRYLRHCRVYDRFSWEQLRPSYIDMIQRCVADKGKVRSLANLDS